MRSARSFRQPDACRMREKLPLGRAARLKVWEHYF